MSGSTAARVSSQLRGLPAAWKLLGPEQRVAAVGAVLLVVSTFGPFTFVEAAQVVTALGVLALLKRRADGARFHLPFGDGTAIAAAGAWAGVLILVRLFDRPLGQNLLALACAALVAGAGLRERAKRPMDDLPETRLIPAAEAGTERIPRAEAGTERIPRAEAGTERISPSESQEPPAPRR